jgi:hypothetical protein
MAKASNATATASAPVNENVPANAPESVETANGEVGENGEAKRKYTRRNTVSFARDRKDRLVVMRSGGEDSEESTKIALRQNKATGGFDAIDTDSYDVIVQAGTRKDLIEAILVEFGILPRETEG